MTSVASTVESELPVAGLHQLSIQDQGTRESKVEVEEKSRGVHGSVCAICLNKIVLQETALIKDCEHAYCVTCILRWATYKGDKTTCPQCKLPFEFLYIHRSLDGSIQDYMFEESVCLLLRASWFQPLIVEDHADHADHDPEDYYPYEYEDEEDDLDEVYLSHSPNLRIGNRRWGDNGYVRAGRQEARPVSRPNVQDPGAGSSSSPREPKMKGPAKDKTGRRAKRTLKREAADKAAAAKHQQHLIRLGRK